ncbi:MAG: GNAT family N-acetyltransferase [Acidimicrobiales bacterium]
MRFDVRPRATADLDDCALALREVYEADRYPRTFPDDPVQWLQHPRQRQAWVAVTDTGSLAGHVALNVAEGDPAISVSTAWTGLGPEHLAVVSRLFVVPACRRAGVARALVDTAVRAAHEAGQRPVLDVLQADTEAISTYETLGWERAGSIVFKSARTGESMPGFVYAGPVPEL